MKVEKIEVIPGVTCDVQEIEVNPDFIKPNDYSDLELFKSNHVYLEEVTIDVIEDVIHFLKEMGCDKELARKKVHEWFDNTIIQKERKND